MKRKPMDPELKEQLVNKVFYFLTSIVAVAGPESDEVIGEGIEKWLKVKTPKPITAKKRKRRKNYNLTVRPWGIRPRPH